MRILARLNERSERFGELSKALLASAAVTRERHSVQAAPPQNDRSKSARQVRRKGRLQPS